MQLRQKIKKAYTLLRAVSRHGHNLISLLDSVRHSSAEDAFIDDGEQKSATRHCIHKPYKQHIYYIINIILRADKEYSLPALTVFLF
jgi:hypothetical protein